MARMIKFDIPCRYCGKQQKAGTAFLSRWAGKWWAHCRECYDNKAREKWERSGRTGPYKNSPADKDEK